MKKKIKTKIKNIFLMTIGTIMYSAAISLFLNPNNIVPGGFSGLSIIMNRITDIEIGTLLFILNVPVLILGAWKFGLKFIISTLYCTVLSSVFINFFSLYEPITSEPILAALTGATLSATGLGIIFRAEATSGGMDIIIKLLRIRFPFMKTGFLFLTLDFIVVLIFTLVLKDIEAALYAIITLLTTSAVMDLVLYGKDGAKMILVISDCPEKIAGRFLDELKIGVTFMEGFGGYSGQKKKIILCIIRKTRFHKAEEIIKEEDPKSFLIVTNANEIYGEGYKSYFGKKL